MPWPDPGQQVRSPPEASAVLLTGQAPVGTSAEAMRARSRASQDTDISDNERPPVMLVHEEKVP